VITNQYFVSFDPKETAPSRPAIKQMVDLLSEHKVVKIEADKRVGWFRVAHRCQGEYVPLAL
jgi:hypothetical protein